MLLCVYVSILKQGVRNAGNTVFKTNLQLSRSLQPLFPYYDYALGAGTPKAVSILRIAGLSSVCNAP